jgi:hypothetical protein
MCQNDTKLIIIGAHVEDSSEDENVTRLHRTQNKKSPLYTETKFKMLHSKKKVLSLAILSGYLSSVAN